MTITTQLVTGAALLNHIDALADLRILVFREYPYLYDGDRDYEAHYLTTYIESGRAMAILAFDDERIIGASTGVPMTDESLEFRKPFEQAGIDTQSLFYCGESILRPEYRGRGLYRAFFEGREKYAKSQGYHQICFCGVVRPDDHPLKPSGYQPLDSIWKHFGYQPQTQLITQYDWKDVDQPDSAAHDMLFWLKSL